jgi:hypothetical protein
MRIYRKACVLHVGDKTIDMDELRTYKMSGAVTLMIAALNPPMTAAEFARLCLLLDVLDWHPGDRRSFLMGVVALDTGLLIDEPLLVPVHVDTQGNDTKQERSDGCEN